MRMDVLSQPASVDFLLGLLWNSDNEGDMFLRNVGISANYVHVVTILDNGNFCSQLI
jgi:hypothetical protein